jgi:hypothetical protein
MRLVEIYLLAFLRSLAAFRRCLRPSSEAGGGAAATEGADDESLPTDARLASDATPMADVDCAIAPLAIALPALLLDARNGDEPSCTYPPLASTPARLRLCTPTAQKT